VLRRAAATLVVAGGAALAIVVAPGHPAAEADHQPGGELVVNIHEEAGELGAAGEVSAAGLTSCTSAEFYVSDAEARTIRLVNGERQQRGLHALCVHIQLTRAARDHSADMLRRDYFKHGCVVCRLRAVGYDYSRYAENIFWGSPLSRGEPEDAVRSWMHSKSHRRAILDPRLEEMGPGVEVGSFRRYRDAAMYTVDLGRQ
jgi:uncharacterized protein YkwD